MIQQRNLATYIILTIVTCGIYGIYWMFCLNDDTNTVSNEQNPTSSGMVFLLCIVTCGIYGIYWSYKQGEKLDRACEMRGKPKSDRALIYLLLTIFGLGIVAYALMQDELNKIAIADTSAGAGAYQQTAYQQPAQQPYDQQNPYQQPYQQPYDQQQYQQPYQQPYDQQQYQQPYQQPYDQQYQQPYQQPYDQQQYQQPVDPGAAQGNNPTDNSQNPNG